MRRLIFFGCGLALAIGLVLSVGAPAIGETLRRVGWTGLLAMCALHLIATGSMGLAWWNLRRAGRRRIFVWARLVRDAGSEVLPLSQIGGYFLGARATTLHGVAVATAFAASVLDATIEFGAQILFITLGLVLLEWRWPDSALGAPTAIALLIAVVAGGLLVALQTRRPYGMSRLLSRLPQRWRSAIFDGASGIQAEIVRIWDSRSRLLWSFMLHFVAWIVGGTETWLACFLMGRPVDLVTALVFESLLCSARAFAFMVPAAVGVQEGAYLALGGLFGISAETALSLSLLKRARDLALGLPALATLQWFEGRVRRASVPS